MNVLCIAGFLGSGKTTILLEVARKLSEEGLAVPAETAWLRVDPDGASGFMTTQ